MSYFDNNYGEVKYPISYKNEDGTFEPALRRPQLGAIHSIASHFTTKDDSAIVVLPTGSGKTAILMMSAYILRCKRALVITPSRLVRNQITECFKDLKILKNINVFDSEVPSPKVVEIVSTITSVDQWEELNEYDVVVVSPNSSSPEMQDVAEPPNDLFDLILVDEAHHSRAKTWESLLNSFPSAKKVLFTATPFRRDQREIKGRLVYNYPVSLAVEDEIFGQIEYLPVEEIGDESDDIRIARQAEKIFREDRDNGLEHLLMVRTDSKKRAEELKKIYEGNTTLNLQLVHSGHTYSHIKSVIKKLEENALDGVICVDMLGEGFDLPQLKIAAIHSPHKSLAITLQFIGRFARTNTDKIGKAKFLAIPSTVKGILERLYIEGADWQKLVIELSETRIEEEVASREVIESFEEPTQADPDFENTSLYSLRPFLHVKIFQLTEDVDLECDLPSGLHVVFRKPNHEKSMDLFIIKNTSKPKWASSEQFTGSEFHLFVVYFDVDTRLLFINSSYKNDLVYDAIANSYSRTVPYLLSLDKVDKVLVDLENFDFFNIGMRSNLLKNNVESYRILTGSSTQKKINRLDGRYFNRGHLFGRANEGGNKVTIGYSSSSKVWSNRYEGISRLLFWCKQLAQKISSGKQVNTFSSLDFLSTGQSIDKIPEGVIALGWNVEIYKKPPIVEYAINGITYRNEQLLDFNLSIDKENSDENNIKFSVYNEKINCSLKFSFQSEEFFTTIENCENIKIFKGKHEFTLVEYLNNFPLMLYFADFSSLCGNQHYMSDTSDIEPFDTVNQMIVVDWETEGVDIRREKGDIVNGKMSIHGYLKDWLPKTDNQIVFIDDSSGEMADFITFKASDDEVLISFYHCKKAHGVGSRVEDAYEVCGQVLKSIIWVNNNEIFDQVVRRQRTTKNSTFLKGEKTELRQLLNKAKTTPTFFEIIIVQPGFTQSSLPEGIGHIIAGANDYIVRGLCNPLKIMCRS